MRRLIFFFLTTYLFLLTAEFVGCLTVDSFATWLGRVQVFNRVGVIMLTASAVSMTATLVLVPTVLALCGPVLFERGARLRMKVTFLVLVIAGVTFAVVFVINNAFGRVLF